MRGHGKGALKIGLGAAVAALAAFPLAAEQPKSADPIKIVVNTQVQFPAISAGDAHVQVKVWEGTMRPAFEAEVASGKMIDAGTHAATTRKEWWYRTDVEEVCPGLPDRTALSNCAEVLALPETAPNGRFLGGAAEGEKHDEERIEALGAAEV